MVVVAVGTYKDGEVAVVALKGLGLVGIGRTAGADNGPSLAVVARHEEVEVAHIAAVAVDETRNEGTVAALKGCARTGEAALPRGIGTAHAVEALGVVNGNGPRLAAVGTHNGLPELWLGSR